MLTHRFHLIAAVPIAAATLFCASLIAAQPGIAQIVPPPAATDAAQDAAKQAFEALPEAERIAVQDSLIWTGDYNGIAAGKFGRATREAIIAFATRNKLPTDGTLDAKGRALLLTTGKQAKDAARFTLKTDAPTGMRIGIPLKSLSKEKPSASGTRYSSPDDSFLLETSAKAAAPNALQDTFNAIVAEPNRKVTYKILKADFFVIAGEQGKTTFYVRTTQGTRDGHPALVGITVTYPTAAKARFDPLLIAISNAFVAFPDPHSSEAATAPLASPSSPATPQVAADSRRVLSASAVAIAPGILLTSLPSTCPDPQIGGKSVRVVKRSETDGLALLSSADPKDKTFADKAVLLRAGDPAESALARVIVLSFTRAANGDELMGTSGTLQKTGGAGAWQLLAPVQNPVAGSAIFDQSGALAGLGASAGSEKTIAGLLPQRSRSIIPAAKFTGFLAENALKTAKETEIRTSGEVAALNRAALFAVTCAQ